MKKIIPIIIISAMTTIASAYTVKYNDIYSPSKTNEVENIDIIVEKLTMNDPINRDKVIKLAKTDSAFVEALNKSPFILENKLDAWGCYGYIASTERLNLFPKIFDRYIIVLAKNTPVTSSMVNKYKTTNILEYMTIQELLDIYPECDKSVIVQLNNWKNKFSNKFIKIFKQHLRSNGKTFVVKKTVDENGNTVIFNPMEEYISRLTTILNNGRLSGINELLKYLDMTERFDETSIPSEIEIKELMYKILIDEEKCSQNNISILKKCLSVDEFNNFIKRYNEGDSN